MGNNPSQVLAVGNAKRGLGNAVNNGKKQLGFDSEAKEDAEKKRRELDGAANRKEQNLRKKERVSEYKMKQIERQSRKEALNEKWTAHRQANSSK